MQQLNAQLVAADEEPAHGVTKFMDLTPAEFKARYLTYKPSASPDDVQRVTLPKAIADEVDWRTKGVLTPVKDQGQCGSCWAFSATEAIESFAKIAGQPLQKLSPQQINSCDKTDGGCNGGDTPTAYEYVIGAGGMESNEAYPYTSGLTGLTGICKFNKNNIVQSIAGYKRVAKSEDALASSLEQKGPVSICLAAEAFQTYSGGILSLCPGMVDHCVQAVGYTADYWIVRNSWNTDWGEDGFIRLKRGKNICKIDTEITYPTF